MLSSIYIHEYVITWISALDYVVSKYKQVKETCAYWLINPSTRKELCAAVENRSYPLISLALPILD